MDNEINLVVKQKITPIDMTVTPQDEFLYSVLRAKYDEYLFTNNEIPTNLCVGLDVFYAVFKIRFHNSGYLNYDNFNGINLILLQNVDHDFIEYSGFNKNTFVKLSKFL